MKIVNVRDTDLQTTTFSTGVEFTTEGGVAIQMESGTAIELDGSVSWIIQIINAHDANRIILVPSSEVYETELNVIPSLVNESGLKLVDENGNVLIAGLPQTLPTRLIHI